MNIDQKERKEITDTGDLLHITFETIVRRNRIKT